MPLALREPLIPAKCPCRGLLWICKVPRAIPRCPLSCQARHRLTIHKEIQQARQSHAAHRGQEGQVGDPFSPRVTQRAGRAPKCPQSWDFVPLLLRCLPIPMAGPAGIPCWHHLGGKSESKSNMTFTTRPVEQQ